MIWENDKTGKDKKQENDKNEKRGKWKQTGKNIKTGKNNGKYNTINLFYVVSIKYCYYNNFTLA